MHSETGLTSAAAEKLAEHIEWIRMEGLATLMGPQTILNPQ
jgi:hypothetical protein